MSPNYSKPEKQPRYGLGSVWKESEEIPYLSKTHMAMHHGVQAWKSFITSPLTSVLTTVTIATALLIFAVFVLIVENIRSIVASAGKEVTVSIYLKDDVPADQVKKYIVEIKKFDFVDKVEERSKAEALKDFRQTLGDQSVILEGLEDNNPLPASLEVTFKNIEDIESKFDSFVAKFRDLETVEHVAYSRSLIDRLSNFLKFFRLSGAIAIVFMLLITSFIITNTIRLALYSHREEIEIMKLVGATDLFVRAPYMIEGFVQGLVGAILALFVSYACFLLVRDGLSSHEVLRIFIPKLDFLSFRSMFLVVISGITVGICGSYLAVRKFLEI